MPQGIQKTAYEKGLIPYVPGQSEAGSSAVTLLAAPRGVRPAATTTSAIPQHGSCDRTVAATPTLIRPVTVQGHSRSVGRTPGQDQKSWLDRKPLHLAVARASPAK